MHIEKLFEKIVPYVFEMEKIKKNITGNLSFFSPTEFVGG